MILDFHDHSLLVFKSTENKVHRGHVTDTECRPDITAAFVEHWGTDATTIWPCVRLAGEDASRGKSKEDQKKQAMSYLHYLILARPDLYVAQGLLISEESIMLLFAIGGKGVRRFAVDWAHTGLYKLMYAFIYRLYDPGHFEDPSYVTMIPDLQANLVAYTIRISTKTQVGGVEKEEHLDCPDFTPLYATNPFGTRTHILSNPFSDIKINGKVLTVLKDQLCRPDPRFEEYTILARHIHMPERVPGVVEAIYHKSIDIPVPLEVSRVKQRIGLRQSGVPITSIPTLKEMLEVIFDVLEGKLIL